MSAHKVFIGWDPREEIAYEVLKYSIEKNASTPVEIIPIKLGELEKSIGFKRTMDPLQSTQFTYTRFLVPYLCNYTGLAVFMDCDMLCLGDINEVFKLDMSEYWLRCVKHDHRPTNTVKMDGCVQTVYPRKNWSSFMLLNCQTLQVWTREAAETQSGRWLHRFEPIPDEKIGEIPNTWNVLDRYDKNTDLIHYTEGGPWFENYRNHPYGDVWLQYAEEYQRCLSSKK